MTAEYIYGLQCPIAGVIMYVGRSFQPTIRLGQHMSPPPWDKSRRAQWIRGLKEQNLRPKVVILEECKVEDAKARENHWIKFHRLENADLVNTLLPGNAASLKQVALRLPPDLHQMVKEEAAKNNKSLNEQIIFICSAIINGDVDTLHRRLVELQQSSR